MKSILFAQKQEKNYAQKTHQTAGYKQKAVICRIIGNNWLPNNTKPHYFFAFHSESFLTHIVNNWQFYKTTLWSLSSVRQMYYALVWEEIMLIIVNQVIELVWLVCIRTLNNCLRFCFASRRYVVNMIINVMFMSSQFARKGYICAREK